MEMVERLERLKMWKWRERKREMWKFEREGGYETGLREIRKVSLCVFFIYILNGL